MERFIKDYVNYKIKKVKEEPLMKPTIKAEKLENIEKIVKFYGLGLVSVDEIVRSIAEI